MGNDRDWPLVERWQQSQRITDAVRRGAGGGLVIEGTAGVGKTRLAFETVRRLAKHGTRTLWITATGLPGEHEDVAARISAHASTGRVVVGIDDAELLGEASGALLARLATGGGVFLLCTTRGERPLPAPLTKVVGGSVRLAALSREATADLLARVVGGQVDGAASYRLWHLSAGNPALLRRLVTVARDQGKLSEVCGVWRLVRAWTPEDCLPDVIRSRVDGLVPEARVVVQAVALCEPLETALLERVFDERALAIVDREGLLEKIEDRRRHLLRLRHPLCSHAVRQAVPPLLARSIHRRLANALEATGAKRTGDATRLGTWLLGAGQRGDAAIFLAGAWEAVSSSDFSAAERLAGAAEQNGGGFEATLALATARYHQGQADAVEDALAGWPARVTTADERSLAALLDTRTRVRLRGTPLTTATDPVGWAEIAMHQGRVTDVLARVSPLVDTARSPVLASAAAELATAAAVLSGPEFAAHGLPAGRTRPVSGPRQDSFWCCLGQVLLGRLAEARALAAAGYHEALRGEVTTAQASWALAHGCVALFGGDARGACGWLAEAVALMRENPAVGTGQALAWALGMRAEATAVRGDSRTAGTALAAAEQALPSTIPVPARWRGRTWVMSASGDLPGARRLALSGAETLAESGAHGFEALALHDAVRLGAGGFDLTRAACRLARLAGETDGRLVPTLAEHAAACADRDGSRLDLVSDAFAELGFTLFAAEAAAQAWSAHQAAGQASAARRAAARCHELSRDCAGVSTPALRLVALGEHLTPREREIATLAAQGWSSRAIADRLTVSVRTVDNHLYRTYTKLGVRGRDELSLALSP